MKRKVLAIFLIVTMLFSLVPTAALATDTGVDYTLVFYGGKVYQDGDISDNFEDSSAYGTEMTAAALAELGITTGSGYTYTFNNVNFSTSASTAIEIRDDSATIVLEETNAVTGGESSGYTYGIETYGGLTITSTTDGTLEVTAGKSTEDASCGIDVSGSLTIQGGIVTANGGEGWDYSEGLTTDGDLIVSAGSLIAKGGPAPMSSSYGICINEGTLMVSGTGSVTGIGNTAKFDSFGIEINDAIFDADGNSIPNIVVRDSGSLIATGGTAQYESSGESYGIYTEGGFEVSDNGSVNATAGVASYGYAISADTIWIRSGEVIADATAPAEGYALEVSETSIEEEYDMRITGGTIVLRASTNVSAYWAWADTGYYIIDVPIAPDTGEIEPMAITAGASSDGSDASAISDWKYDGSYDISAYKYMKFEPCMISPASPTVAAGGTLTLTLSPMPSTPADPETSYWKMNASVAGDFPNYFDGEHSNGNFRIDENPYVKGANTYTLTIYNVPSEWNGKRLSCCGDGVYLTVTAGSEEDDADDTTTPSTSGSSGFSGSYNYPVNAPATDNGSAILSDSNAVAGESVTITTKPNSGYGAVDVIVTDEDGNEIEITALGNGQYTFVMPEGGADVQVVYKPAIVLTVGSLYIDVFGKLVKNDVTAILTPEGRMMLPIRVIAEALGADVDWDADTQKVTITKGDTVIEIFIGADYAIVNGEKVALDSAAFIKDNRTYLPVRFISEYLGADVNWYADSKTVTIVPYDVK